MIDIQTIGSFLLHASIVVAVFSATASVLGRRRQDGRLMLAGERAAYALAAMVFCASILLFHSFLTHDYTNKYVARYSDNNMPWYYLLSSFWGGQAGSLLFWELVLALCTALVVFQNRDQNRDMLPTVIAVLMGVHGFFLIAMVVHANPFATYLINEPPINGRGLEPLLQNPAMTFHPPSILSGYVWWTIPFAFAIAALIHRRLDDAWIRATRRYAIVSWGFLSVGNLFGGMWAYQELGWGGFWGWDPVENASLMPWFTASAYLHSVMIQERRGMLKVWNMALVILTYFLTVFGTFLTRSGLIDSVHTFAQSDIGGYFIVFMVIIGLGSLGLLGWRILDGSLRSKSDVQNLLSREGIFLLNNLVLLGCVGVVMFGTLGEKISAYLWQETKYTASWFNAWMVPGGLTLIILMGVGPLIPWRKATAKALQRNMLVPFLVSVAATAALVGADAYHLREHLANTYIPFGEVPLARLPLDAELVGVYATIGFAAVFFVVYTMTFEFIRGARVRGKSTGEGLLVACFKLSMRNKRRYGGYLTHIGFAGLFLGFIGTGLKTEQDLHFAQPGAVKTLEDKQLTFKGIERDENREYSEVFAVFDVHQLGDDGQPTELLGTLRPSRRNYHGANVRMSRVTTEKDELFLVKGNVYLAMVAYTQGSAEVMAHYNPLIFWMWFGGAFLLFGVVVTLWPGRVKYPVFAAAMRRRKPAAAADPSDAALARTSD